MLYHSGGDSVVLGIAPASSTSWDIGPRRHIRFGVGRTLKKEEVTLTSEDINRDDNE